MGSFPHYVTKERFMKPERFQNLSFEIAEAGMLGFSASVVPALEGVDKIVCLTRLIS